MEGVRYYIQVLRTKIIVINKNHRLFNYCDEMCFKSKNLYNYANYIIRQEFINNKKLIFAFTLNAMIKDHETFKALPAKTSQQIIIQLGNNWKSYFRGIKDWSRNKEKYCGKPNLPKYKNKNGRNVVFFDYQQGKFKDGKYYFQRKKGEETLEFIETNIPKDEFRLLKIRPYGSCYKIEIVYRKEIKQTNTFNCSFLSIDLGINNLATLTNNIGLQPIVINGKILKSINNYYNKIRSKAQSYIGKGISKRLEKIDTKRNNIVDTHLHRISRWIINYCLQNNIQNIVIGRNKDWKRFSNMGNKNNQRFYLIPFEQLIEKIIYKGEEVGINVEVINEMYTSKSSFIDNDIIPSKFGNYTFSGQRVKRGLYQSGNGTLINADVNGSYNILRKSNPEFIYNDRIKGISLYPIRLSIA